MFELNDLCHRLLQAIVSAPLAWQSPPQLATRLGLDLDATTDALADLDLAGWIDPWEMGEITYVTLSPAGAERLRVRLVLIGRSDAMRWSSLDDPEPEPPRASGRHEGMSALDFVSDPARAPTSLWKSPRSPIKFPTTNSPRTTPPGSTHSPGRCSCLARG
jgi:hypothetical protein